MWDTELRCIPCLPRLCSSWSCPPAPSCRCRGRSWSCQMSRWDLAGWWHHLSQGDPAHTRALSMTLLCSLMPGLHMSLLPAEHVLQHSKKQGARGTSELKAGEARSLWHTNQGHMHFKQNKAKQTCACTPANRSAMVLAAGFASCAHLALLSLVQLVDHLRWDATARPRGLALAGHATAQAASLRAPCLTACSCALLSGSKCEVCIACCCCQEATRVKLAEAACILLEARARLERDAAGTRGAWSFCTCGAQSALQLQASTDDSSPIAASAATVKQQQQCSG